MDFERKSFTIEAKADAEAGVFRGYMSAWDNVDSYGDVMVRGAFDESLANRGLPMLSWEHDWSLGPIGKLTGSGSDDHGQWVEGRFFLDSDLPRRLYEASKGEDGWKPELSFAFITEDAGPATRNGENVREVRKVALLEAAIVVKGANDLAQMVSVRSAGADSPSVGSAEWLAETADADEAFAASLDALAAERLAERTNAENVAERIREIDLQLADPIL